MYNRLAFCKTEQQIEITTVKTCSHRFLETKTGSLNKNNRTSVQQFVAEIAYCSPNWLLQAFAKSTLLHGSLWETRNLRQCSVTHDQRLVGLLAWTWNTVKTITIRYTVRVGSGKGPLPTSTFPVLKDENTDGWIKVTSSLKNRWSEQPQSLICFHSD